MLCKPGLDLEQFCTQESLEVEKGVKTSYIRPAGRKHVEVKVTGLGFNTPDSLVQDYIVKFGGKLVTTDVIYEKYSEGTFQGKLNGVRKYNVDFTKSEVKMGTFHILDGRKVKVFYRGNRTCGWCHGDASKCPGGAKAKDCKEKGTEQVNLAQHMKELWNKIKFDQESFELDEAEYDDVEGVDTTDNFGGDRRILESSSLDRSIKKK